MVLYEKIYKELEQNVKAWFAEKDDSDDQEESFSYEASSDNYEPSVIDEENRLPR